MLGWIRSFFSSEKKEEEKLLLWALVGFLFLSFTLFFLPRGNWGLWSIAFLSPFLCWLLKGRGCLLILLALVGLGFYQHMKIDSHLERLAIELSLGLSIVILHFSLEHLLEQVSSLGKHRANLLQNISFMEEEMRRADSFHLQQQRGLQENTELLQKELQEKKDKISSIELLIRTLKRALIEEKRERENVLIHSLEVEKNASLLSYDLEELKKEDEILKEKNPIQSLVCDLNALRQQQYQEELSQQSNVKEAQEKNLILEKNLQEITGRSEELLKSIQQKESQILLLQEEREKHLLLLEKQLQTSALQQSQGQTIQQLQSQIKELQAALKAAQRSSDGEKMEELKKVQSLYQQLRKQFDDKDALLHQTRKELFLASEKILAQEKESVLLQAEEVESEKRWIQEFIQIDEELLAIKEENHLLEEIVSSLSVEMARSSVAPVKKRGRKKKNIESHQELLFKNS